MEKQQSKINNYETWLVVLAIVALSLFDTFIILHCLELRKEVNLLSSISETVQDDEQNSENESNSDLSLEVKSNAYFYDPQGDQLGVGPWPPVVGIQTNVWIFWEASNSDENLKDFKMSARLPKGVIYTDNKSLLAGTLHYNRFSRRIVWTVDEIKEGEAYRASFEVGVIPKTNDAGKVLNLVTDINCSVANVQAILADITTNLIADKLISGTGEVISFE